MFDALANELVLDVFDYLDAVDIFRAFADLNARLNTLLSHYQSYQLNFCRISKTDFTAFCQTSLPSIIHRLASLELSDDDDTPNLGTLLLSNYFPLDRFTRLQSLTLRGVVGPTILTDTLPRCHHLTHLDLIQCRLQEQGSAVLNQLWSLPRLVSLSVDSTISLAECFSDLSHVSPSIQRLRLKNASYHQQDLASLFQWTPRLQHLSITLNCREKIEHLPISASRLTSLNLSFCGSRSVLASLFEHLPELRSLQLSTAQIAVNGHQWKELLVVHLPRLRDFRLKMEFLFNPEEKKEDVVAALLATFQTAFWLTEHRWFVRCDWSGLSSIQHASLYTLPYAFEEFHFLNRFYSRSTCPEEKEFWSYEHVTSLQHIDNLSSPPAFFPWRFVDLRHLEMVLPCCDSFLTVIPSLSKLDSLDLTILPSGKAYLQLQTLLDRAIHLRLLKFSHLSDLDTSLFELRNSSVRRLDFYTKESMLFNWYFDREQCRTFAFSSFGQQCETLLIDVEDRTSILELIDRLPNLRALTIQCQDDGYARKSSSTGRAELVQWLTERLPASCSISREKDHTSILHIWIR